MILLHTTRSVEDKYLPIIAIDGTYYPVGKKLYANEDKAADRAYKVLTKHIINLKKELGVR